MYELLKCKHFNCDRAYENKLLKHDIKLKRTNMSRAQ